MYYEPVRGARITFSGIHENGQVYVPTEWQCPRCGQDVHNAGGHLVVFAPCRDCREYLRKEEGDMTCWNKRTKAARERRAAALEELEVAS